MKQQWILLLIIAAVDVLETTPVRDESDKQMNVLLPLL